MEPESLERRDRAVDRRRRPTPALSARLFLGRRRGFRRSTDPQTNYYVDRPPARALKSSILLLALSALDAILSLRLFALGRSEELNPLLDFALDYGSYPFLALKFVLTTVSIFVVLLHWNFTVFRKFSTVSIAYALIALYCCLIVYEIILLA